MINLLGKIFKSSNQRRIDSYQKVVNKINLLEEDFKNLTEEEFRNFKLHNVQIPNSTFTSPRIPKRPQ